MSGVYWLEFHRGATSSSCLATSHYSRDSFMCLNKSIVLFLLVTSGTKTTQLSGPQDVCLPNFFFRPQIWLHKADQISSMESPERRIMEPFLEILVLEPLTGGHSLCVSPWHPHMKSTEAKVNHRPIVCLWGASALVGCDITLAQLRLDRRSLDRV